MTTKERVIIKAQHEIETELKKINHILESDPLIDIINLRKESIGKAKKMTPNEAVAYLDIQTKKEQSLFALARKQQNSLALIDRKVELERELVDLKNELFFIERRSHMGRE